MMFGLLRHKLSHEVQHRPLHSMCPTGLTNLLNGNFAIGHPMVFRDKGRFCGDWMANTIGVACLVELINELMRQYAPPVDSMVV